MFRVLALVLLAMPALAAPGPEAAADMRCAALMTRVGDALERAGHHSTLATVRGMQATFLRMADGRETPAETGFMGELARMPPISLPASTAILTRLRDCAARLPP